MILDQAKPNRNLVDGYLLIMHYEEHQMHKILTLKETYQTLKISRTSLWRLERSGEIPGRIKIGQNRFGYLEYVVNEWLEAKL